MLIGGFLCLAAFTLTGRCIPILIPLANVSLDTKLELYIRETPPVPDIAELKKHLHVPEDRSLFYSDPGGYAKKQQKMGQG